MCMSLSRYEILLEAYRNPTKFSLEQFLVQSIKFFNIVLSRYYFRRLHYAIPSASPARIEDLVISNAIHRTEIWKPARPVREIVPVATSSLKFPLKRNLC